MDALAKLPIRPSYHTDYSRRQYGHAGSASVQAPWIAARALEGGRRRSGGPQGRGGAAAGYDDRTRTTARHCRNYGTEVCIIFERA